jgi:hypothetical protein
MPHNSPKKNMLTHRQESCPKATELPQKPQLSHFQKKISA